MARDPHHEDFDDDDPDPEKGSRTDEWVTRLCGSGAQLWPHISLELTYLSAAAGLAVVGAIFHSACTVPVCSVLGGKASSWFMWAAFSCAISVPGRVIDKLLFSGLAALGEILAGISALNTLFFYVGAFESAFSRFWWLMFTWTTYETFLTLENTLLVENTMQARVEGLRNPASSQYPPHLPVYRPRSVSLLFSC